MQEAGVRASDSVWDRDSNELERAGFILRWRRARAMLRDRRVGYEEFGRLGSVGSCLSKILTQRSGVLINVPC